MEAEYSEVRLRDGSDVPVPVRQLAMEYDLPDLPFMPGASWADLAENDPEMRLMGPPPCVPPFVDPEWVTPKRTRRPLYERAPANPFLEHTNAFAALDPTPASPRRAASVAAQNPFPSASSPERGHRSGPLSECTPSAWVEPPSPTPSPRTD